MAPWQALGAGDTLTDTFIVTSGDGSATQTVTVTINGPTTFRRSAGRSSVR